MALVYPQRVTVVEVGPRDGLQSLPRSYPAETKARLVDLLAGAGLPKIEVTAFSRPEAVPRLADADEVFRLLRRRPGTVYRALVPNARGAARALAAGADELLALLTVSERYNRRNSNMGVDENVREALRVVAAARAVGVSAVVAVGLCLFCPYEGDIPRERTLGVVRRLAEGGAEEIYLATSSGVDAPRPLAELVGEVRALAPELRVGVHLHDTNGMALACALAALDAGATAVEGAICGIGGGIRMPAGMAPVGNVATEDLVALLAGCGVETGVDPEAVAAAAGEAAALLGLERSASHALAGGTRAAVRAAAAAAGAASPGIEA